MVSKAMMDEVIYRYGWARSKLPWLFKKPLGYFLYITGKCNLDCNYCWQRDEIFVPAGQGNSAKNVIEPDEWVKVVRNMPPRSFIGLSGGEVTMSPALEPIVKAAKGSHPITINTNALSIKDEHIKILTDSAVKNISISLDGFDEVHDKSRNRAGLFNTVVSNIEKINKVRKRGATKLTIKTVLLNENVARLKEFHEFCEKRLEADVLNISFQKTKEHSQFSFLVQTDLDAIIKDSKPELLKYHDHEAIVKIMGAILAGNRRQKCQAVIYPRMKNVDDIRLFLRNKGQNVSRPCYLPFSMVVVLQSYARR